MKTILSLVSFLILVSGSSGADRARVAAKGGRGIIENKKVRAEFRDGQGQVSVRRGGEWYPVAILPGMDWLTDADSINGEELHVVTKGGSVRFNLKDHLLLFETQRELFVEVLGKKTAALFPGLDFLEGGEFSSSDRDAHGALADRRRPEAYKITVPLMAYEADGVLVSLMWSGNARLFFEAREKNRMSLGPTKTVITMTGAMLIEDGATISDAVPRWIAMFGLPAPEPWPRSLESEIELCKTGFQTVRAADGTYSHCVGWKSAPTPGFAVLLHLLGEKVDWEKFPDLNSSANCHILRWEAPFYSGKPEAVKNVVPGMKELAKKRVNGEWSFQPDPKNEKQVALGKRGDTVLGTSAHNALMLAKAARMTGNAELKDAALDTLRVLRKYKIPRGAQSWECPLYEPDILAAAYAVGAYVEAYKLSGDKEFLADAQRWAKAGLPFIYLWNLPGNKMMRYGSVPVFGTTHYTHSWFGVPVQWNGLVYAYYLRKLAPLDKSFPWQTIADGITASAVHQQYADGTSKGCYPDAIYDQITRRSPADINPENILVNILTALGKDPDPDLKLKP